MMNNYEKDQERLLKFLVEVETEEESNRVNYDDESDEILSDRVETEIHETDSEQNISESAYEDETTFLRLCYKGKYLCKFMILVQQ
ncbi:hypothetical protein NQ314_014106 [Rhamnusium bicolor]|uniref:Uncharacterized protein n=1 Tax=Rhamnusium bicolor TaxID=1586634 RepID=A0AAV8X3W7_9CUCU|nr:hypothetical protein NQ314_014106 [Rhamnusium bicolor]